MGSRGLVIRNDRSDSIDVPGFPQSPNIIVSNYFNHYKEDGKFTNYLCPFVVNNRGNRREYFFLNIHFYMLFY